MQKPKKWTEVYPQGTKEGNEESKLFRALARNPKYEWRTVAHLAKQTGLSRQRVEEIIDKYHNKYDPPLIYPHSSNEDMWGYWERIPEKEWKKDLRTTPQKDQENRINQQIGASQIDTTDANCSCGGHDPNNDPCDGDCGDCDP